VSLRHDPAPRFNAFLLNVDFASAAGDEWSAIGGGDSIPEAIAAARDALRAGLRLGARPLEPPLRRLRARLKMKT
jgi:hypothetical protein